MQLNPLVNSKYLINIISLSLSLPHHTLLLCLPLVRDFGRVYKVCLHLLLQFRYVTTFVNVLLARQNFNDKLCQAFTLFATLCGKGMQFFIRLINCSGGAYMPSFIQLSDERLKLIYLSYLRSSAKRKPQHGHDIITKMQGWRLVQSKCQTTDASADFVDCSRPLAATSQLSLSLSLSLTPSLSLCLPLGLPIG